MLLTIDVGNTNTVLGVFRGEELIAHWRLTTARLQTVDEYGVLTRNLFTLKELDPKEVHGVIVSSVVPPMNWTLSELSKVYFGQKAMFVEPGVKTGMAVLVDNPLEVGADRMPQNFLASKSRILEKSSAPIQLRICRLVCTTAQWTWSMACSHA